MFLTTLMLFGALPLNLIALTPPAEQFEVSVEHDALGSSNFVFSPVELAPGQQSTSVEITHEEVWVQINGRWYYRPQSGLVDLIGQDGITPLAALPIFIPLYIPLDGEMIRIDDPDFEITFSTIDPSTTPMGLGGGLIVALNPVNAGVGVVGGTEFGAEADVMMRRSATWPGTPATQIDGFRAIGTVTNPCGVGTVSPPDNVNTFPGTFPGITNQTRMAPVATTYPNCPGGCGTSVAASLWVFERVANAINVPGSGPVTEYRNHRVSSIRYFAFFTSVNAGVGGATDGHFFEAYCVDPQLPGPRQGSAAYVLQTGNAPQFRNVLRYGFPTNPRVSADTLAVDVRAINAYNTRVAVAYIGQPASNFYVYSSNPRVPLLFQAGDTGRSGAVRERLDAPDPLDTASMNNHPPLYFTGPHGGPEPHIPVGAPYNSFTTYFRATLLAPDVNVKKITNKTPVNSRKRCPKIKPLNEKRL